MRVSKRHGRVLFLTLALLSGLLAVWAAITGGFRVHVFGIPISVRGEHRAAFFAVVFATVAWVLLERERRWSWIRACARLVPVGRIAPLLAQRLWVVPLAAAAIVLGAGLSFATRSAGGADTYGYVSQAKLWLHGDLRARDSRPAEVPWPGAEWTFTPLGYRPSPNDTIVPTYSPGLPLLMALAEVVVGDCGPFVVVPLCASLLVWLTYVLGSRVTSDSMGIMSSLCVATCPTVVIMTMSPMSDVPATTFWTASLVLACRGHALSTAFAGAAAGLAIIIRPNLAPLAVFPLALAALPVLHAGIWPAARRALFFVLACAPAVLFVGWLFDMLYGSPLESGYGRASGIYALIHVPANLANYPRWLWETQGSVPFLFLLTPWLAARGRQENAAIRWLLFGFVAATFGAYVAYEPFDVWWYLRFLLPAFPAAFVLAFDAAYRIGGRIGGSEGRAVTFVVIILALGQGAAFTWERDLLHVADGERKYADAGRFIAKRLPEGAVILSMQHSGAARLYSGRLTLRYDSLEPEWLDRALAYLRSQGREPYLLLEDWEVPIFRERFAGQEGVAAVDAEPLATMPEGNVLIFSTDGRKNPQRMREIILRTSGCAVAPR